MCNENCCYKKEYGHEETKTVGHYLHEIQNMVKENFDALHEQIEELEDKVERLEKTITRK